MPIAGVRNENGFTSVDRAQRLHQTGVLKGPSDNLVNHYHTRYSSDYQFKPTRGLNETTRQDLLSGFAQNHHYQKTGLNLPAHKPVTNFTSTYNASFEELNEPGRFPEGQPLPQKAGINFTTRSGFVKNLAHVHPDERQLGASTESTSQFQNRTGEKYPEYMSNGVYATVAPANSGFVKNNRQQPTFNVSAREAETWMKTTNTAVQEASESALRSTREYPIRDTLPTAAELNRLEKSGYNRSILRQPSEGVGTEHNKLQTNFDLENTIPITEAQQVRILQQKKRDDPIGYQHVLDGQQRWQSTYTLAHQAGTGANLARGKTTLNGQPGANGRQPGDSYMKDMQGPYSTTTKRSQIFEATQQAHSVNQPQVVNRGWVTTGFTQNNKDPKSQQPWMNDMRAGVDVFSKGAMTSSQIIGQGATRDGDAGVQAVLSRRTNEPNSSYGREYGYTSNAQHGVPVIPTGEIKLRPHFTQRPASRERMVQTRGPMHATVADLQRYDGTVKRSMKNYGNMAVM